MKYQLLSQTYRDDVLADALYAREVEYFHYDFDRRNFEHMLISMPEGKEKDALAERLRTTIEQMHVVESVYAALKAQITDQEAHAAAVERAAVRRLAKHSETQGGAR